MIEGINMFEVATRSKLRFGSNKGNLSVEQLWDVPLRSRNQFNLDAIAQGFSRELKAIDEESFVDAGDHPARTQLEVGFAIVKHIIAVKLAEEVANKKKADNRTERQQLLRILEEKQQGALSALSVEELQNRIEALA